MGNFDRKEETKYSMANFDRKEETKDSIASFKGKEETKDSIAFSMAEIPGTREQAKREKKRPGAANPARESRFQQLITT